MSRIVRQVGVELRAALDTRAPRWAFASFVVGSVAFCLLVPSSLRGPYKDFVASVSLGLPLLVGALAVVIFTADWTTRAALVTFVLTPDRRRVILARYLGVIVLTISSLVVIHVLAAAVFVLVRPGAIRSLFSPDVAVQFWAMTATTVASALTAMAVGGLVLRTVPAILVAVFAPFLVTLGLAAVPVLLEWLNPYAFASWLAVPTTRWTVASSEHVGLGPAIASFALWTAVPLVLGWLRQMRAEPR